MTENGRKVMAVMRDGEWRTPRQAAELSGVCQRNTKNVLVALVSTGDAEHRTEPTFGHQFRLKQEK